MVYLEMPKYFGHSYLSYPCLLSDINLGIIALPTVLLCGLFESLLKWHFMPHQCFFVGVFLHFSTNAGSGYVYLNQMVFFIVFASPFAHLLEFIYDVFDFCKNNPIALFFFIYVKLLF